MPYIRNYSGVLIPFQPEPFLEDTEPKTMAPIFLTSFGFLEI